MSTNKVRSAARLVALTKSASVATDYLATLPTAFASGIPGVGQLASLAGLTGTVAGLTVDPEKKKNPETTATSLIPGVGHYRMAQRARRVMDVSNAAGRKGTANLVAEVLGGIPATAISGAAGAGIGHAVSGGDPVGTIAGGVGGAVLPALIASIVAGIRRRRTMQEQVDSDTTGRAVAKWLVPGLGQYDYLKRIGASGHLDEGAKKKAEADRIAAIRSAIVASVKGSK